MIALLKALFDLMGAVFILIGMIYTICMFFGVIPFDDKAVHLMILILLGFLAGRSYD